MSDPSLPMPVMKKNDEEDCARLAPASAIAPENLTNAPTTGADSLLQAKEALLAEVWVQGRAGNIAAMIEHVVHAAQLDLVVYFRERHQSLTAREIEEAITELRSR